MLSTFLVWTKITNVGNSKEKFEILGRNLNRNNDFPTISGKVVDNNRARENTIRFLEQFFGFPGGGGNVHVFHLQLHPMLTIFLN